MFLIDYAHVQPAMDMSSKGKGPETCYSMMWVLQSQVIRFSRDAIFVTVKSTISEMHYYSFDDNIFLLD